MSKNYAMTAVKREGAGKGVARTLRRSARTPAIVYGDSKEPVRISISQNEINILYNRGHMYTSLCDLDIDGEKHLVLARDVQLHPVTDVVEHVDFMRVNANTKIAVMVPVHFINQEDCPSLDQKGTLNVVRHEVELMCSATDIPEFIEVDVAGKEHGDAVKISNARLPVGVKPVITNRDFVIATLVPPKTAAQEEAEAAKAAAAGDGIIKDEELAATAASAAVPSAAGKAATTPAKKT